ncbi:MAG TPA: AEC family transporter [Thermoproteales archaeon]|nr:AEC family transporter [Thermoproteales archaeon]
MERLIEALVGFYVPLGLGFLYKRKWGYSEELAKGLSRTILYFFFPMLIFNAISRKRFTTIMGDITPIFLSSIIATIVSLTAAIVLFRGDREMWLPSFYLNAVYLPTPIAYALWGPESIYVIGFYVIVNVTTGNVLAPILLGNQSIKKGVKRLAKYPPIYAVLAGLIVSFLELQLPPLVLNLTEKLGSIAPPLALYVLGYEPINTVKIDKDSGRIAVIRFLASPFFASLILPSLTSNQLVLKVLLLESTMPPAVANVVLANEFSQNPTRISQTVLKTTLISTILLPLYLIIFGF